MITVAGIQMACGSNRDENLSRGMDFARIAVERGAKIVCFAECFAWSWFPRKAVEANRALAEPVPGPMVKALQALAESTQTVLVAPLFEATDDGQLYNTTVVIDASGVLLGLYRKNHIPELPNYQERFYFTPGNLGFPVFQTRYGLIGVQTCWDNFFPEGARALAIKGAQIIFSPTACSSPGGIPMWDRAVIGHAVYNCLYAFRVNRVGTEGAMTFYGRSFCVEPKGEFVTDPAGGEEGVLLAELDLDRIALHRNDWTFLAERRPAIYRDLV